MSDTSLIQPLSGRDAHRAKMIRRRVLQRARLSTVDLPAPSSKYMPHNGQREMARRVRQMGAT